MTEGKRKSSKTLWTVLFVVLNIAVIAYIAFSEFGKGSGTNAAPQFCANWGLYLVGALGCFVILLLAETTKYAYMMHLLGQKCSWRAAFETAALGKYYDCITPSGIGGQPFQIYCLHKYGYSDGAASAMPVTGFITMQSGFVLLGLIVCAAWRSVALESIRYTAYVGLIAYAFVPCLLVAFSCKPVIVEKLISAVLRLGARMHIVKNADDSAAGVLAQLRNYREGIRLIAGRKKSITVLMALSLIYHAAFCSIAWFSLTALGGSEPFLQVFAATVYVYASATIIVTPGNSGAAEGAFYLVFSTAGPDGIFWAVIIWRLISYYAFIAVGGLIYGYHALLSKQHVGGKHYGDRRK